MKTGVEFLMWLAQNNPDRLSLHADDKDWGEKAFTRIHAEFVRWRGKEATTEHAISEVMKDAKVTLAETDYNIGFLNGMERALALLQKREPNYILMERLRTPKDALKLKELDNSPPPKSKGMPGMEM